MSEVFEKWWIEKGSYHNDSKEGLAAAFNKALDTAIAHLLGKPKVFRSNFERDAVVADLRGMKVE